jgi:hypothetical protein
VLFYVIKISNYASIDAKNRKSRLRPSAEDKIFKPILAANPFIISLSENIGLFNLIDNHDVREKLDDDLVRLMYNEFLKTEDYNLFLTADSHSPDDFINIYLNLLKTCLNSAHFQDVLEDNYSQWIDDESLVVGAIKKTLKQLPVATDFYKEYIPSEEATVEFGEFLLETVFFKDKELLDIISPNLQNWDAERVSYFSPYLQGDKFDILKDGEVLCKELGLDFDEVYSRTNTSYKPIYIYRPGKLTEGDWYSDYKSASSVERIEAFIKLGRKDPAPYADGSGPVTWEHVVAEVTKVLEAHNN